MRDINTLPRHDSLCNKTSTAIDRRKCHKKSLSVPDLKKLKKEWDLYQHSDTENRIGGSKMQIDVLNIRLYQKISQPSVRLRMGPSQYCSKRSTSSTGDWNEGFLFHVSYHAQLFNTIEFDLYDKPHKRWPTIHHIGKAKLKISTLAGKDDIFVTFLPIYEYRSNRLLPSDLQSTIQKADFIDATRLPTVVGDSVLIGSLQIRIRYHFQEPVTIHDKMPFKKILSNPDTQQPPQQNLGDELYTLTKTNSKRTSYGRSDLAQDQSFVNDVFNNKLNKIMSTHVPGSSDSLTASTNKKKKHHVASRPRQQLHWMRHLVTSAAKLPTSNRGRRYGFAQNDNDTNSKFNPDDNDQQSSSTDSSLSSSAPKRDRFKHDARKKAKHIIDSVNFGDRNFASQWMEDSFDDVALSHPLVDKLIGLVVSKQTQAMVRAIIKTANSFGQGFRVTSLKLLKAALLIQRFYESLPKPVESKPITDFDLIDNGCHYFAYAVVSYGWRGLCYLGAYGQYIRGAKDRRSNRLAIIRYLHMDPEDLLGYEYALRKGASFQPSYFIALDKRRHTIVLSIRGTWSLYDAITDLVCEYMPWKGGLVHSGMLASAQWFYTNIIPQIFRYIHHHNKDIKRFVITGHSLGGGTASLLTMMVVDHLEELRSLAENPTFDFHCYSYAPPASSSPSLKYEEYITSFVCQDDIVGRLSYGSAMKLKELILDTISAYKSLGGFRNTMTDLKARSICFDIIRQRREKLVYTADMYPSLYIPGRIVHIQRSTKLSKGGVPDKKSKMSFSLHYTDHDISNEVKLSKTCIEDHMISAYQNTFVALREEYPSPFADSKH